MRRLLFHLPTFLALLGLATGSAQAQRVAWQPAGGSMGLGKANDLSLVFEECAPDGPVTLPEVEGVEFGAPSTSTQTSIANFKTSRRTTLTYAVRPQRRGSFTIPTFSVATDKGRQVVTGVGFEVGEPAVGQTGLSIGDVVESQLRLDKDEVWVGEVVEVEYVLIASTRYQTSISGEPRWEPPGLVVEAFGQPERAEAVVRGERRPAVRYRTRLVAAEAGRLSLPAVRQSVTLQTGERASFFFSQPRLEEFTISSNRPAITVKALPAPAPADFTGAVGRFTLESKVVPESVRVGDPVTWTLALRGTGNWTANLRLPEREVSTIFEVVQPKSRQEMETGKLFTGSLVEDAVLVPTQPGIYLVGPVRFSYFDPARGTYATEVIQRQSISIDPPLAPRLPSISSTQPNLPPAGTGPRGPESAAARGSVALPADLPAVPALPREPVPDGGFALPPFVLPPAWWLFVAFIPPCLAWMGLAWREARRGDLARGRRAARRELLGLMARLARLEAPPSREDLAAWRALVIRLWLVPRAAPTRADLAAALERLRGAPHPEAWLRLWEECEAALFRPGQEVSLEWLTRAAQAAREVRVHRMQPAFPHRWKHWAPAGASALVLAAAWTGPVARAATDPALAYREGRFAEARSGWLGRLAKDPLDWSARNNTGLAFAQEERWPEAAAHWTAAFLLEPREASVRANLTLALSRLDGIDPDLRRLLAGGRIDRTVSRLSPGEWQALYFAGAAAAGTGLLLIVVALYRPRGRGRRLRRAGMALAAAGALASVASIFAETRYGLLARPTAGLVVQPTELRSIPTDLAEKQQTAPLPPGTVVVVQQSFLGWDQVVTGASAVGWVRREVVTPFYRAPRKTGAPPARTTAAL